MDKIKIEIKNAFLLEHGQDNGIQTYTITFDIDRTTEEINLLTSYLDEINDGEPVTLIISRGY